MEMKLNAKLLLYAMLASVLIVATGDAASLICGGQTITAALRTLPPGDTLFVSGSCTENVVIAEQVANVILDGQGTATINARDPNDPTINVRGNGITIRNFASISDGETGILVTRGGAATIDNNIIQNNHNNGIVVNL